MAILIEVENPFSTENIQKSSKVFKRRNRDFRSIWRNILPVLASESVKAIKTSGRNFGEKFEPLTKATIKEKRRKGKTARPLVLSGALLGRARAGRSRYRKRLTRLMVVFGPKAWPDVLLMGGSIKGRINPRSAVGWNRTLQMSQEDLILDKAAKDVKEYMETLVGH